MHRVVQEICLGAKVPRVSTHSLRKERAVTPISATVPVGCDVRIVAGINRPLTRAVQLQEFRADPTPGWPRSHYGSSPCVSGARTS